MQTLLDPRQIAPEVQRPLRRAEYERLVSLGFFEDERVELLYGVLVAMTPMDPGHCWAIEKLTELLVPGLMGRAKVRIQMSFAASDDSEPEPDVAVVPPRDYRKEHPSEAFLIIEVSFSSQRKDRVLKAGLYAECGVPEYWVVDVPARTIDVFTRPVGGRYESVVTRQDEEYIAPTSFPDVMVRVADLF
jgi:Uma2 family endonuclease